MAISNYDAKTLHSQGFQNIFRPQNSSLFGRSKITRLERSGYRYSFEKNKKP